MNFNIVWSVVAQLALADIWARSSDWGAVARACRDVERLLSTTPHAVGVVTFDTVREYTHGPLGIEFEVVDPDCRVFVLTAWETAAGRPNSTGN